MKIDLTEHRS